MQEFSCPGIVENFHACLFSRPIKLVDQASSATHGGKCGTAPKGEFSVDLERLTAELRKEADALTTNPVKGRIALFDQDLAQIRIRAILRHPGHIVEELLFGV